MFHINILRISNGLVSGSATADDAITTFSRRTQRSLAVFVPVGRVVEVIRQLRGSPAGPPSPPPPPPPPKTSPMNLLDSRRLLTAGVVVVSTTSWTQSAGWWDDRRRLLAAQARAARPMRTWINVDLIRRPGGQTAGPGVAAVDRGRMIYGLSVRARSTFHVVHGVVTGVISVGFNCNGNK